MKTSLLKPIIFGAMFGAAAFFVPLVLLKVLFFFMVIGFIFRMLWWDGGRHRMEYYMAYTDKIRNMSNEEYESYKTKMRDSRHKCGGYQKC
jgi:hypothetical protein